MEGEMKKVVIALALVIAASAHATDSRRPARRRGLPQTRMRR